MIKQLITKLFPDTGKAAPSTYESLDKYSNIPRVSQVQSKMFRDSQKFQWELIHAKRAFEKGSIDEAAYAARIKYSADKQAVRLQFAARRLRQLFEALKKES